MVKRCVLSMNWLVAACGFAIRRPALKGGGIAILLIGLLCWLLQPAKAQLPTPDDQLLFLAQFPAITVRVGCDFPATDVSLPRFALLEDGIEQQILETTRTFVRPQTETAIFIDLFDGQTAVVGQVGDALEKLYNLYLSNTFTVTADRLAVYAPANGSSESNATPSDSTTVASANLDVVVDWTGNAGVVVNNVRAIQSDRPFAKLDKTALMRMLLETLTHFDTNPIARRILVVFSDGSDVVSGQLLDQVVAAANAGEITIHTFLLNTGFNGRTNLMQLADETDGQFEVLAEALAEPDEWWKEFWGRFVVPKAICDFTYRTGKQQPQTLLVRPLVTSTVVAAQPFTLALPAIAVNPPVLRVQSPKVSQQIILPPSVEYSATVAVPIELAIAWDFAPAAPRLIKEITYEIKGLVAVAKTKLDPPPPPNQSITFSIPLTSMVAGSYAVNVTIVDELGVVSQESVPFTLFQPVPTSTPIPTQTPTVTPTLTRPPTRTSTPMPTATLIWHQKAVATAGVAARESSAATTRWFRTDFPYRALLVGSTLFFVGLVLLLRYLWQKRVPPVEPSPSSLAETPKVYAILYRLRSDPGLALQQVVKLYDREATWPEEFYTHGTEIRSGERAKNDSFGLRIFRRDKRYLLNCLPNKKAVTVRRGKERITVEGNLPLQSNLPLQNNDEIQLGQTSYAFYELLPAPTSSSRASDSSR